jgi:membrane protein implicated in regulation of membrane protease activity
MPPLLDAERIFYAGAFGTGLIATVYAMLHGSVRVGHDPTAAKAPPAAFNTPVLGTACIAFGAVGYLLAKYSQLDTITVLLLAILAAAAGWIGMTVLMARWALKGPIVDPHEELEELQGTVATVIRDINKTSTGQIQYNFRGKPLKAEARSIDGEPVLAGTDVVIEKIENGVADVELWSAVEQRL